VKDGIRQIWSGKNKIGMVKQGQDQTGIVKSAARVYVPE
jgi:hypothetical protein